MRPSLAAPAISARIPRRSWGLPPELGILAGVAVAAALGVVFGYLAIRRQGIYFAMITLAFAQMVYFVCPAGALHRRRGRHPGGAARASVRHPST